MGDLPTIAPTPALCYSFLWYPALWWEDCLRMVGWAQVEICALGSNCQKTLKNTQSWSLIIVSGTPWSLKTLSKKVFTTWTVVKCHEVAILSLSTISNINDLPPDFASPSAKSMDISLHTIYGVGSGCNKLVGNKFSALFFWHTSQFFIKSFTWCNILFQKNPCLNRWRVFVHPSWVLLCISFMTIGNRGESWSKAIFNLW